ncbi:MAG: fibronectin type III domain-containing protein [Caldilineaceae bacterium]|nr:fibronectin type III domain-containing protein [Caldilineaceae bacterium]
MVDVKPNVIKKPRPFGYAILLVLVGLILLSAALATLWMQSVIPQRAFASLRSPGAASDFAGRVQVQDIGTASPSLKSDRLLVEMADVGAPPSGRSFYGYILGSNGQGRPFGPLAVAGGAVNANADFPGRNLVGAYSQVYIMQESRVFSATLPTAALSHLRTAVDRASDTPGQVGYSVGLVKQAAILHQHAGFAKAAADAGNLNGARLHTEHVLNILYGESDSRYGDHDEDGFAENPGDGYGLLHYSSSLSQTLQLAAAAADATPNVQTRVAQVQTTLGNIGSSSEAGLWSPVLIAAAAELLLAGSATAAQAPATQMVAATNRIYNGTDFNDNGEIEPVENEGGAIVAHRYTQRAADYLPPSSSGVSGSVQHRDADNNRKSDRLTVALTGLPTPAAGEQYYVYLVNADNDWLWLGGLAGSGGTLEGTINRTGVNLIAGYQRLYVSVGALYADGDLPPDALNHLRMALHRVVDTPDETGFAVGLMRQAQLVYAHAGFAKAAADGNNLPDAKLHVEHVLNILYGESDPRFGDHDEDGFPENPGDGYGLLRYSQSLSQTLQQAADSADATDNIRTRVAEVQTTLGNIGDPSTNSAWVDTLIARAEDILNATTAAGAQTPANQLVTAADRLLNGTDLNDNGVIDPLPNEGGARTAYRHTQYAVDYTLELRAPSSPLTPTPLTGTPSVTPTSTPTGGPSPDGDAYEADDSCEQAKPIAVDGSEMQMRTFHAEGDVDWVKFTAQLNKTYVVEVRNVGPKADAVLYLHDVCAAPPSAFEGKAFGSTVRLIWNSTKAGDYFLQLQQFDPSFFGPDTHYHLTVTEDVTPPTTPINLRCVAIDATTLGVQWQKSPETDVVRYRVTFRNQTATSSGNRDVAGADQTYVEIDNLAAGELFDLQVVAIDFSGNESGASAPVQCRAAAVADPTQPVLTLQQPTASGVFTTTAAQVTFTGFAQDAGGNLSQVHVKNLTNQSEGRDFSLSGGNTSFRVENLSLNIGDNDILMTVIDSAGNTGQKSQRIHRLSGRTGAVIIVAGHNETFGLQTNIYNAANRAYRIFKTAGFSDDNIFYISPTGQDADGNGSNDVDAPASPDAVQQAITGWAKENGRVGPGKPLFLYMIDHGFADKFCVNGCSASQVVTPEELNGWLKNLEDATGLNEVNIVIEACQSGSFIDRPNGAVLNGLGGAGRVVITSTDRANNAYASAQGAFFSDAFFSCVADSNNLKVCFEQASAAVAATGVKQLPWMDDNGDGVFNSGDGAVAQNRHVTAFFSSIRPEIRNVEVIRDGANGQLVATLDEGAEAIGLVWATIFPPSFEEPDGVTLNLNAPTVRLDPDPNTPGRYLFNYVNGFTEDGDYRIVFYAQDRLGIHAVPRREGQLDTLFLPILFR